MIEHFATYGHLAALRASIEASCAHRKALRLSGKVPVSGYVRTSR